LCANHISSCPRLARITTKETAGNQQAAAFFQPVRCSQARTSFAILFGSGDETYKNSPRSCRFRALNPHDGREVIPLREIHQMNCFDDDVCLWGILLWRVCCLGRKS
jgi:hypothetical protein